MNVYDFDKTIYDGDSSIDFYAYNLSKSWVIALLWPSQLMVGVLYKLKLIDKTLMKQIFYAYFRFIPNIDKRLDGFWKANRSKIKAFYATTKKEDDIIVSASPEFMLEPICRELGVRLIASRVDKRNGVYTGKNCFGEEKVKRFRKLYPDAVIEVFYSDSLSDSPMAKIANEAVFVVGEQLNPWPKEEN